MIYLLDRFDPEIIGFKDPYEYFNFTMWEASEKRIKGWIENERCRSIFSRQEIINLFNFKEKIQMVKTKSIRLKKFDKIILWTPSSRYFVLEVIGFKQ